MRLGPEQAAVLAIVRAALGREPPEGAVRRLRGPLDWGAMERLVRYNGVAPLVREFAGTRDGELLPVDFARFLETEHLENLAVGLLHGRALAEIAGRFDGAGLRFVALKGLALAHLVYPRPELRPAGTDIDLLVRRSDYDAAKALLLGAGYALENPATERHRAAYVGEVHFARTVGGRGVRVDLHTDFNANHFGKVSGFSPDDFWEERITVPCAGGDLPHLPPWAAILFLAVHLAANHLFDRLIPFCDLDLLIRRHRDLIDWPRVARRARQGGAARPLYFSLHLCRRLLDTPVPDDLLGSVAPGRTVRALLPERFLLIRREKPPKPLERAMHLLLLDDPRLYGPSVALFARRILAERSLGRAAPPAEPDGDRSLVARVRAGRDPAAAIAKAIALLGGLETFVSPGDRVLIKPNFNSPDPPPATTDLAFLREVVRLLQSRGIRDIAIGESSGLKWQPTARVLQKRRVPALARELGVELVDFDAGEWVEVEIPGRYLKKVRVPRRALEADRLIYLANLKTHPVCRFSASLKLAVGMIEPGSRRALHADHPEEKVADIGLALRPSLILLDARRCFVTGGPDRGRTRRPGVLLASADPVAIDVEGVKLLQSYRARNRLDLPVWELPQIAAARSIALGAGSDAEIHVVQPPGRTVDL